jgi:hypothetical protein
MTCPTKQLWLRFKKYYSELPKLSFVLDTSRMSLRTIGLRRWIPKIQSTFDEMAKLEAGAIGNPDENRMVEHSDDRDNTLSSVDSRLRVLFERHVNVNVCGKQGVKAREKPISGMISPEAHQTIS